MINLKGHKVSILLLLILMSFLSLNAQNSQITIDKNLIYKLDKTPEKIDNHNYTSFYTAGKDVFNLKSAPISHSSANIIDFKVNPAGYSYAVLSGKGKKYVLTIYDTNVPKRVISKIDKLVMPTAIAYSPDSRSIYLADNSQIIKLSSKTLSPEKSITISGAPSKIFQDPEGLYIVCIEDNGIDVYNEQEGTKRVSLPFSSKVIDATFSKGGDKLLVLCENGRLEIYNIRNFSLDKYYDDLQHSTSLSVHPDDKYVAISKDEHKIQFLNLLDDFDRPYITDAGGPINYARFVTNGTGDVFITFDAENSIVYKRLSGFIPNYNKIVRDKLNELMREWTKMRPMETEEEYNARVNPESIEKQRKLFANEIATSLAGDLISHGTITLGSYNPQTGLLTVNIGSLPPIYLQVPPDDMATFGNGNNLQFSNVVYGITPGDTFELIYVEAYNPTNGKNYVFNNLEREDLSLVASDDSFVSLDLIMKSNQEDVVLKGIKDRIVEEAKAENIISDHTVINVETHIEPAFDANGNSINNYCVAFNYTVDGEYSGKEDFPPGKYMIETSNAASSMMRIIKQAFENDFSGYLDSNKKLKVEITGSADGAPIRRGLPYDGSLGIYDNEPVTVNGELTSISVSPQSGIKTNEQLAFMRAQSLHYDMLKQLPLLEKMNTDYRYYIDVSKDRGGEYRRISVVLTFIDAL